MGDGNAFTVVICPLIGMVLSNVMFLSPLKDVQRARAQNSLGALNPIPYPVIFANCILWVTYGVLKTDWFLFLGNAQGACLGLYFTVTSIVLAEGQLRTLLERMLIVEFACLMFLAMIVGLALSGRLDSQQAAVGSSATIVAISYYVAPLTTLAQVLRTKDASSLSLPLAAASFVNALVWVIYGIATHDAAILIPNTPGVLCGSAQMILHKMYKHGPPGGIDLSMGGMDAEADWAPLRGGTEPPTISTTNAGSQH